MSMLGNTGPSSNGPLALKASLFIWVAAALIGLFLLADRGISKIAANQPDAQQSLLGDAVRTEQTNQDLNKSIRLHAENKTKW